MSRVDHMPPQQIDPVARRGTRININGYALREMRKLAGITTTQLVREVSDANGKGFDRSFLNRIENGQRTVVNPDTFARIVRALGIDRRALRANPHQPTGIVRGNAA